MHACLQGRRSVDKQARMICRTQLEVLSGFSKTDAIMSRYRPIAPKPLVPHSQRSTLASPPPGDAAATQQQPSSSSLRRTRKRSRPTARAGTMSAARKKAKPHAACFPADAPPPLARVSKLGISLHGFGTGLLSRLPFRETPPVVLEDFVRLPRFIPPPLAGPTPASERKPSVVSGLTLFPGTEEVALDLNRRPEITQEDMLLKPSSGGATVITPQPVRPVGSSISVGCIITGSTTSSPSAPPRKRAEEVEEEVESEAWPSVVSDSRNKVRLTNSAYKQLVGQPECPWLDSMAATAGGRIGGEVVLDLSAAAVLPISSNGFSCKVKIEWGSNGRKSFIHAPCDVERLCCDANDYVFTWRFLIPSFRT